MIEHGFTSTILQILESHFQSQGEATFHSSELLQYLNIKTKAANEGSKSRASFGNIYAIYVLIEDYLNHEFQLNNTYPAYEGAQYSYLMRRQRQLPFGSKLQNHALNHRLNQEFKRYFPTSPFTPILRDKETRRYWFNERLLMFQVNTSDINIAESVKEIIEAYVETRQDSFKKFLEDCQKITQISENDISEAANFIQELLKPNVDARIFEIVSYAILKEYYAEKVIYWGWSLDAISPEFLQLYKTGRTNANDSGIDFVMKPLGKFFQVIETIDIDKFFLDIDKVQKFPITFVIKTHESIDRVREIIQEKAMEKYSITKIVERYMEAVEEVINIPTLLDYFQVFLNSDKGSTVIQEIESQSRLEFDLDRFNS